MRLTFQLKRFHRIKITFEEIVQRCVYVELIKDGKEGGGEEGADKPITLTIIENEQWRQLGCWQLMFHRN